MNEVNTYLEEKSALINRKELYEIHKIAINDAPYSFSYINTNAEFENRTFLIRFGEFHSRF